jgi:DinB family protein
VSARSVRPLILALAAAVVSFVPSRTAAAQDVFDAKTANYLRNSYLNDLDTLHARFIALANAIPADKYSWRPSAEVRTISEVFMHVVGEFYYYGPMSIAGKAPADFGAPREKLPALEKQITTKDAVIAELNKSWTHYRKEVVGADVSKLTGKYKPFGVTIDQAAMAMTDDLHEHLGQLIAYSRSVGVKPPWSK